MEEPDIAAPIRSLRILPRSWSWAVHQQSTSRDCELKPFRCMATSRAALAACLSTHAGALRMTLIVAMKDSFRKHVCTLVLLFGCAFVVLQATAAPIPTLRRQGTATQLIVYGEPFLFRGGELGNSTGEPDFLRQYWPRFSSLHLNGLLVPVYWELIEPEEGSFDFATVDHLLADARANEMRLVLLWFGSWKNSLSSYVPTWVKRDFQRFSHSRDSMGRSLDILSPFDPENRDADARAFAALMRHLREIDGE